MLALGIDVGGSGIKAAVIDTTIGRMKTERFRIATPKDLGPAEFDRILVRILREFKWKDGPVGVGFPGVIDDGVIKTAANMDKRLIGWDMGAAIRGKTGSAVAVINDADAAGLAEMRFGAGQPFSHRGTVLLITVGTGIGTVLFRNGMLIPNLELGHLEYKGADAESLVSERARKQQDLTWPRWGELFNGYLLHIEMLLQPNFIILGGGGVKKPERFVDQIKIRTDWAFATFGNRAGIIGCALAAIQNH